MTRPIHRRAFTLMEIVVILPILAALTISAYSLASRVEAMQSREASRRQDDVRIRDLVRRVQEDTGRAAEATTQDSAQGRQLTLRLPNASVTYAASGNGITRIEQPSSGEPAIRYEWSLNRSHMDFQIEEANPKSRLVWILCTTELTFDQGPGYERRLSAVATVGRGGLQ